MEVLAYKGGKGRGNKGNTVAAETSLSIVDVVTLLVLCFDFTTV